jgi:ABC-2 type transport system ATP-binding protein
MTRGGDGVVRLSGLRKEFGTFVAVADLSLAIARGEIVGLVGPNGAGKTTTIHMMLSLIAPTAGTIEIFGLDLQRHRSAILSRLNFASPDACMDWRLTVRENLRVFAGLYAVRQPQRRIDEVLDLFEMRDIATQSTRELSLGQQTRLGLCRAFLNQPELVLLDEPTNSLDPDIADKTRRLLLRLRAERGLSMLYTSHNMAEVEQLCDRVLFLHHGRVMTTGTPLEVSREILRTDVDRASLEEVFLHITRNQELTTHDVRSN